eukprot:scaffold228779_cov76-Cyclotella_meneghiniana.AAC.3
MTSLSCGGGEVLLRGERVLLVLELPVLESSILAMGCSCCLGFAIWSASWFVVRGSWWVVVGCGCVIATLASCR